MQVALVSVVAAVFFLLVPVMFGMLLKIRRLENELCDAEEYVEELETYYDLTESSERLNALELKRVADALYDLYDSIVGEDECDDAEEDEE